ncbi:hypothetical protein PFISCL1PPCAC_3301, partial [Pristionchus fissidentatus]
DSSGKVGAGVLRGHAYFVGHYSECKAVDYVVQGRERNFRADYFRMDLDPFLRMSSSNDSCNVVIPVMGGIDIYWEFGVCMPASCSSRELQSILRPESHSSLETPVCRITKTGDPLDEINAGFYITLSIMGVIVAICMLAGVVDYFFSEKLKKKTISRSLGWCVFMSCSLYSNISSIFDIGEAAKSDQIAPIHCIRFFSMAWVLMSHLFSSYLAVVANPDDVMALAKDWSSEVIINGFYSVDSFFFMSGVLLTFLWFKSYNRHPKETMSVYGWIMFYVHRILRLSPAFYILVIFFTFVLKQMLRDSPINMNDIIMQDSCSTTWWIEMLYLHNWIQQDKWCISWGWYLAADMQMYIFTPLLLIPLALKPLIGFLVATLVFTFSTAVNIFLVYYYHWPAAESFLYPADPEETNIENYSMLMYESPLIRCQIVYLVSWVAGLALMLTVLLGLHNQTNGELMDIFWRAMYSAFSRPAWGIGLSVILIMCFYGYGGPINAFMSWHIWVPLGRLSYCGYLIHIPTMLLVLSQTKDEEYFSNFIEFFITRVMSIVGSTYFFAIFWSACFEISFGRIEKLLLMGGDKSLKVADKKVIEVVNDAEKEKPWGKDPEKQSDDISERI